MGVTYSVPSNSHTPHRARFPAPRKPRRNVDLQVLCLGLPRTGTASLREALRFLRYGDVYHFTTVYNEQPFDAGQWTHALKKKFEHHELMTRPEWDTLTGNCEAVTDIPCVIFALQLMAAYPDAKVILTVRDDAKQWEESYNATIKPWFNKIYEQTPKGFMGKLKAKMTDRPPMETMCELIQKHYLSRAEENLQKFYVEHNEMILENVSPDRLLIYNVKEGWEPICRFLGKKSPPMAFPRLNDREGFPKMFADPPAPPPYTK